MAPLFDINVSHFSIDLTSISTFPLTKDSVAKHGFLEYSHICHIWAVCLILFSKFVPQMILSSVPIFLLTKDFIASNPKAHSMLAQDFLRESVENSHIYLRHILGFKITYHPVVFQTEIYQNL